jgi:L-lactate dehydrogenase complex protein LldG
MSERAKILARIREALRVKAKQPGAHDHNGADHGAPAGSPHEVSDWLPAVGESFEERLAAFRKQSGDLRSDFHLLESEAETLAKLGEIARTEGWSRIGSHRGAMTDQAVASLGLPALLTDARYDAVELEKCDAGISQCDALVAQTGSVLVTTRSAGGRALSVLPPHHVVLARRDQLLRDLPAAFAYLRTTYGSDYPSFMSLITGPSRTGDIERILVLGAHGPRKLTILCW